MKKSIILIAAILLSLPSIKAQKDIAGVTLPAKMDAGGTELVLNGGGLREKWFLDLYVAGLYVTTKSNDGSAIMNANEPMAIRLKMVSGLITSEKMDNATREGFEKSTKGNIEAISSGIEQFVGVFSKEAIVDGDLYDIKYEEAAGTKVYKNGSLKATIPGYEFKKALFGIWLCDDPADDDLKEGMLGL